MNESKLITGDWDVTAPTDKGPRLVDEPLVFSSKEKHGTRHREIQKASVAAGFRWVGIGWEDWGTNWVAELAAIDSYARSIGLLRQCPL